MTGAACYWNLCQWHHQVVAKMSKNKLSRFFHRLRAGKSYNVAITALARKLISIIFHLLINQELYQENNYTTAKTKPFKKDLLCLSKEEQLKDGVAAIVDAFITWRRNLRLKGVDRTPYSFSWRWFFMGKDGYASGRTPSRPVLWNPEIVKLSLPRSPWSELS